MQRLMIKAGRNYRLATKSEIGEAHGLLVLADVNKARPTLETPAASATFLKAMLAGRDYEVFAVVLLDNRHRVIEVVELFRGTIDGTSVHPREVVKVALFGGAAAVILAHNHPSGVAEPSQADELITLRLRDALALIDVRVLDHVIVAGDRQTSLASRGIL